MSWSDYLHDISYDLSTPPHIQDPTSFIEFSKRRVKLRSDEGESNNGYRIKTRTDCPEMLSGNSLEINTW